LDELVAFAKAGAYNPGVNFFTNFS
jgi:hypothetical protein